MLKKTNPQEAHKILEQQNNAVLVDVRSTMEYSFVGHPLDALHIPLKEPPSWDMQPEFVEKVRTSLAERMPGNDQLTDVPVLMLCRSGQRSELAGEMLIKAGFTNVYNVLEGFEGDRDEKGHRNTVNGWRFHGLPWEQS
ncbi:MAG: rhodanese-like domain-containing protein [marine bacterium B5-7]|nr:MAG: rhodanese-like domain-containing protein [marine bacterium B5-7]